MQIAFAPYTRLHSVCRLQGRGDLVMEPGGRRAFVQFNRITLQGVILPSHSLCIMESSDLAFQAWGGSGGCLWLDLICQSQEKESRREKKGGMPIYL